MVVVVITGLDKTTTFFLEFDKFNCNFPPECIEQVEWDFVLVEQGHHLQHHFLRLSVLFCLKVLGLHILLLWVHLAEDLGELLLVVHVSDVLDLARASIVVTVPYICFFLN